MLIGIILCVFVNFGSINPISYEAAEVGRLGGLSAGGYEGGGFPYISPLI